MGNILKLRMNSYGLFYFLIFIQSVALQESMLRVVSKRALALNHILKGEIFTKTKFYLTTRETIKVSGTSHLYKIRSAEDLTLSTFDPRQKSMFIIPGWQSYTNMQWMQEMTKELLVRQSCNVFQVSWAESASNLYYPKAAHDLELVGNVLYSFIHLLESIYSYPLDKIHLIGFSMGAHIAGFAGEKYGGRIGRITGLDPAGPLFNDVPPAGRLDYTDAHFVDVIHTSSDGLALGTVARNGHIDFWPNGGVHQPGCGLKERAQQTAKLSMAEGVRRFQELSTNFGCSHFRSAAYFTESINSNCKFIGKQCESYGMFLNNMCPPCDSDPGRSCISMGYNATWPLPFEAFKNFYLLTDRHAPYCLYSELDVKVLHDGH